MRELRTEGPNSQRWLMVPGAVPLLFQAGLTAREMSFQVAVVRLQIALEEACAEGALIKIRKKRTIGDGPTRTARKHRNRQQR
jgi:hypothetical protein